MVISTRPPGNVPNGVPITTTVVGTQTNTALTLSAGRYFITIAATDASVRVQHRKRRNPGRTDAHNVLGLIQDLSARRAVLHY